MPHIICQNNTLEICLLLQSTVFGSVVALTGFRRTLIGGLTGARPTPFPLGTSLGLKSESGVYCSVYDVSPASNAAFLKLQHKHNDSIIIKHVLGSSAAT